MKSPVHLKNFWICPTSKLMNHMPPAGHNQFFHHFQIGSPAKTKTKYFSLNIKYWFWNLMEAPLQRYGINRCFQHGWIVMCQNDSYINGQLKEILRLNAKPKIPHPCQMQNHAFFSLQIKANIFLGQTFVFAMHWCPPCQAYEKRWSFIQHEARTSETVG